MALRHARASLLGIALASSPAPASHEFLFVENSASGDISVIDVPAHRVAFTIPASVVGHRPDDVVVSPDGRTLYVNRLETRDVLALDTKTGALQWSVAVGGEPNHMAVSDDGRSLYVPLFSDGVVEVIDTERHSVHGRLPASPGAHVARFSPDRRRLYVGGMLSGQITVVDLTAAGAPPRQLDFPDGIRPFEITPDERQLFVQTSKLNGFYVYDLEQHRITQTVHLPPLASAVPSGFPFTVNHGMRLTRDGRTLMVANTLDNYVAFYTVPDLRLSARVQTGAAPGWLTLSTDERFLYSSNRGPGENTVSVISMAEHREIARIKVGDVPQRMAAALVPDR